MAMMDGTMVNYVRADIADSWREAGRRALARLEAYEEDEYNLDIRDALAREAKP